MKMTGVFLSDDKFRKIQELMSPKISMDLRKNITIIDPGDKEAAWKVVDDFAEESGLPVLPDGQYYGLTSNRELVSP